MESLLTLNALSPALLMNTFKETKLVINVDSLSATMPLPGMTVYSATKGYLRALSLGEHNTLTVSPGAVDT